MANPIDRWLERIVTKAIDSVTTKVDRADHGADSSGEYSRAPSYSAVGSMAAFARFPFLYAATVRRAADMSSLPVKLYAGHPERDPDAEEIVDHPLLDLIDEPNETSTGEEYRRQCAVDLFLTGDCFSLKVGASPETPPVSLVRMHPESVRIVPQRFGGSIKAYELNHGDEARWYDPGLVIHVRAPSWENGPQGLYGQGTVRALSDELNTKLAAREHQRKLAGQGRPDIVLSPSDEGDMWGEKARAEVLEAWARMSRGGGPLVMSGAAKAEFLNLSPRDMEYQQLDASIISAIMAATQTPPILLGKESANYATARQQDGVYWRGIQHESRLFDARWTMDIGRLYGRVNGKWLYLRHDFAAVLPLQGERTAQVDRAHKHILAGATPAEAYAYEGLAGAPVSDEPLDLFGPAPTMGQAPDVPAAPPEPTAPEEPTGNESDTDPADLEDRARVVAKSKRPQARSVWEGWLVKIHKPAERRIRRAAARYLNQAANRYARRLAQVMRESSTVSLMVVGDAGVTTKAINIDDVIATIEEKAEMEAVMGESWRRSWMLAATAAAADLPIEGLVFDPSRPEVVRSLARFFDPTENTQANAIRTLIEEGIADGLSVNQMQASIRSSSAMSPARALRIARTESTRAVNQGTINAYQEAAQLGLTVKKVWLTAGDGERHPTYAGLDGQERDLDQDFDLEGVPAPYPGGSDEASEDINCRCTTIAKTTGGTPLF